MNAIKNFFVKYQKVILIGLTFLLMFILNSLTPLIADDIEYMFKTTDFSTILLDEYNQYMTWTGRSIVHIIARIFLLLPKFVFNIFNALAYILLTVMIYHISTREKHKFNGFNYLLINILIWLFVPTFGQTILWETGAANYLWGSLIIVAFISVYHRYFQQHKQLTPSIILNSVLILILGTLAGWSNENTSGGALIVALGYTLYTILQQRKLRAWMILGIIGNIFGLTMMATAPGNAVRAQHFERSDWSFISKLYYGVMGITNDLWEHRVELFVLAAIVLVLAILSNKYHENLRLSYIYFLAGLATIYVLALSPAGYAWGRSFFGGVLFIIIGIMIEWPDSLMNTRHVGIYATIYAVLFVNSGFLFVLGAGDIVQSYRDINRQYAYVEDQKAKGNYDPMMPEFKAFNRTNYPAYSHALSHVKVNPESQVNRANAEYFGINTVRKVNRKAFKDIYEHGDTSLLKIWDPINYLTEINNRKGTIILSVSDRLDKYPSAVHQAIENIFPNTFFDLMNQRNFVGISGTDSDEVKQDSEYNYMDRDISGNNIIVESSFTPYHEERFSKITVNDKETSRDEKGINITFIDDNENLSDAVNIHVSDGELQLTR